MTLLKNRCYRQLDLQQGYEQAGFRKTFSTIDHIHTLGQLIEKTSEFNINIALMFIDFSKAFDSPFHDKIWSTLASQGVQTEIITLSLIHI